MEHQLDATITVLLISKISLTRFGQTFAHLQERKNETFTTYGTMSCYVVGGISGRVAWHYLYVCVTHWCSCFISILISFNKKRKCKRYKKKLHFTAETSYMFRLSRCRNMLLV
jgi:hypothetical protein